MTRPSYKSALKWIARNDDCEWLSDEEPLISVTASLVADMFGKADDRVIADLRKVHAAEWRLENEEDAQ